MQQAASAQQHRAADPKVSVFVNANAGSGKTYLLVNRVIRLLLDGAAPESLLCLTYTKAAAAEMRSRLFERLARWIDLDDAQLLEYIRQPDGLNHADFPADELSRARQLFARALETPGGLRVMTIHGFCQRLLQLFPVEAGLPPGFEILDEAEMQTLLDRARQRVLTGDLAQDGALRDALAHLATWKSEPALRDLLAEMMQHRRLLLRLARGQEDWQRVMAQLTTHLGIEEAPVDADEWRQQWVAKLDAQEVQAHAQALASIITGLDKPGPNNLLTLDALRSLAEALDADDMEQAWAAARKGLLTKQQMTPRVTLVTKAVADTLPGVARWLEDMQTRFARAFDGWRARVALAANEALLTAGAAVALLYEEEKLRLGKFDYDDLILRTLALLDDANVDAQWVLYRLDGGIEHILLDEAQDTSPEQWRILERLTEEFTGGDGVERPRPRTVFAVGDVKQSIYSFQGAAPEAFERMRRFFQRRFEEADLEFRPVPLHVSFRTVQPVLEVVERVLEQPDFRLDAGGAAKDCPRHESARPQASGAVELWPPEELEEADEEEDIWTPKREPEVSLRPQLKLAARIAGTIRRWLDGGAQLPPLDPAADPDTEDGRPRPVRPRDVLILVRQRTTLMEAIVSALKQRGVPVAGVDRLRVSDHIAVRDMLTLLRFLLLAEDDLSLAAVLKSPLVERDDGKPFSDDDLLRLRGGLHDFAAPLERIARVDAGRPLWEQLRAAAKGGAPVRRALTRLEEWRNLAGYMAPYELLTTVLWRDGGMRRFLRRLGREAEEPLEALLDLALAYERNGVASLLSFVEWMLAEAPEIKREAEGNATGAGPHDWGEVRVMTVHGAKGLESPIVFLADTFSVPDERRMQLVPAPLEGDASGEYLPVWTLKKDWQPPALRALIERAKQAQEEEYNRLLYVAMTRAADRLYICGAPPKRGKGKDENDGKGKKKEQEKPAVRCWYDRLREVLARPELEVMLGDGRKGWRYPAGAADLETGVRMLPETSPAIPPGWARRDAPQEPEAAAWISPSKAPLRAVEAAQASTEEPVLSPLAGVRRAAAGQAPDALRRGVLIHKLLQYLPELPREEWQARALAWLTMPGRGLDEAAARALWREVGAVLADARFAPLFGPSAQAEVPFAARLPGADGAPLLVQGQIDRLALVDDAVIVADFKTARPVPAGLAEVVPAYLRQLALYRLAMRDVWPDKRLRAGLLFTAGPAWLEVPEEMLENRLPNMDRIDTDLLED